MRLFVRELGDWTGRLPGRELLGLAVHLEGPSRTPREFTAAMRREARRQGAHRFVSESFDLRGGFGPRTSSP